MNVQQKKTEMKFSSRLKAQIWCLLLPEWAAVPGTGAAPVVAEIAQEMGLLTVAVVTKPFAFEREQKMLQAERGIEELKKYVDSLIVIPNEKLLDGLEKQPTMMESFSLADDILKTGVKSISDLITEDGY